MKDLKRSEEAKKLFLSGYNCAQAVLYGFRDELGLSEETAMKISCGLGAGMARQGEVCGAVTGGILVLGMRHGRTLGEDRIAMETTYEKTRELMEKFALAHGGSCLCRKLLNGCDLSTGEGRDRFKEKDYLNQICLNCVQSVVDILERI